MLLIPCPWCGPRAEIEFRWGGQSHIARPADPATSTDAVWADYLFFRDNPRGWHRERWCHKQGCGIWFNLVRDTVGHSILQAYAMGTDCPIISEIKS